MTSELLRPSYASTESSTDFSIPEPNRYEATILKVRYRVLTDRREIHEVLVICWRRSAGVPVKLAYSGNRFRCMIMELNMTAVHEMSVHLN